MDIVSNHAVLNYGPILTVREPFMGCEPVITDSRWEGTYLYFTGWDIPYKRVTDQPNNIGSVVKTITPEEGGGDLVVKSIAIYSYPSVKEFTTYIQVSNDNPMIFTDDLETDFTKYGTNVNVIVGTFI